MVSLEFALHPHSPYGHRRNFQDPGAAGDGIQSRKVFPSFGETEAGQLQSCTESKSMPNTHFRKPTGAPNPWKTRMSPLKGFSP